MKINIRNGDLEKDRNAIVSFSQEYLNSDACFDRFQWLNLHNPFGKAKVWIAYDEVSNEIMGICSAFPRLASVKGRDCLGWVLGDFCIHPSCRSLGPALLLQKTCLMDLEGQEDSFIYDFPSLRMMAIYKRMGLKSCASHVRFVKPLRIDKKVTQVVKWKGAATSLGKVGNLALQVSDWAVRGHQDEVTRHEGVCGKEFSDLFERAKSFFPICIVRSADYLNWRYNQNPLENYELWTYRQDKMLKGYLVVLQKDEGIHIVDFFSEGDNEILKRLILAIARYYRQEGFQSMECCFSSTHSFLKVLKELHFLEREGNQVVVCGKSSWIPQINKSQDYLWWLTSGDRDS